jgi:hypothetical chaperone protein
MKQSLHMSVRTNVYGDMWDVDHFAAILVRHLLRAVQKATGAKPDTLVVGHPVVFPGCEDEKSNDRALQRLFDICKSESSLPEENIHLVLEPEAALRAWHTAAPAITNGSTILALDFGGGTFDAAIGRRNGLLMTPELQTGVPVGGETFDALIFQKLVAPQLGIAPRDAGAWSRMSMLRRAASPNHSNAQPPAQLRPLLQSGKVYQFWDALEDTKRRLSDDDQAEFRFVYRSSSGSQEELKGSVTREQFEEWVAPDMDRVFDAIDKLLQDSGVSPEDIDAVLLAGGTSQVPLFKNRLVKMFGQEKIQHTEDPYTTIAYGLAEWARENLAGLDPLNASDARKKAEPVPARATQAAHATSSGDPVADDTHGEWMGHLFDSEIQKTEPLFSDSHVSAARDDARAAEEPAPASPAHSARPEDTFTEDETTWLKALAANMPPIKVLETYPNLNFLSLYSAAAKATSGARAQGADSPPARKNMAWSRDELGVVAWLYQIGTPVEVIAHAVQRGPRAVMFELVNMGLMPESALDE